MTEVKKPELTPQEKAGLLEEFRSLRSEILNAQGRRLQPISLTIGAFGLVLSVIASSILGPDIRVAETRLLIAVGGGIALYAILIPGLLMTISTQQTIQRLGEYIRVFLEPQIPGLNWERRWHNLKQQRRAGGGLLRMSDIFYFLSLVPLLLPLYAVSQNASNWTVIFVLVPFLFWALYLAYDLQAASSKSWKWSRWDSYKETDPVN